MKLLSHFRITFMRTIRILIRGGKTKIYKSYLVSLTIYHDIIWLEVVKNNRRMVHYLQYINKLAKRFNSFLGFLDTTKGLNVSAKIDIQPLHDKITGSSFIFVNGTMGNYLRDND